MRSKQDHSRQRRLRREQTDAEAILWLQLRDRRLGRCKFRRQHRIGVYFVDFVCIEAALVVELDGSQHIESCAYDAARTVLLEARGYRVLRFWNDAIFLELDAVLGTIVAALAAPHPPRIRGAPSPRKRGEGTIQCGARVSGAEDCSSTRRH